MLTISLSLGSSDVDFSAVLLDMSFSHKTPNVCSIGKSRAHYNAFEICVASQLEL